MTDNEAWFNRAWQIDKEINILKEQQRQIYDDIFNLTPSFSIQPKSVGKQDIDYKYAAVVDFENSIKSKIDNLYAIKLEIEEVISKVNNARYRNVLRLRYILFYTWEQISEELQVDARHIYRLRHQALSASEEFIKIKSTTM